jgi:uncharacterized protein
MKKVTTELLDDLTHRIVNEIHPDKIILFGSYAWGTPGDSSDIDIFIILNHSEEPSYRRARRIHRCLAGIGVAVDVVVKTSKEVEYSKNVITSLTRKVLEEGKILYG